MIVHFQSNIYGLYTLYPSSITKRIRPFAETFISLLDIFNNGLKFTKQLNKNMKGIQVVVTVYSGSHMLNIFL